MWGVSMNQQKKWTDEEITQTIKDVMNYFGIDRMPTHSEMCEFCGDTSLSNKVSKTGGAYYWADKLGIEVKQSETLLGYMVEAEVKGLLEALGFQCELTSTKHPYDILVNGCVKIDVKSARKSKVQNSDVYSFGLAKQQPTCDIYIAVCLDDNKCIERFYVIPAHIMAGKTQLCIGVHQSKYDSFIDRWDIVKAYETAFIEIC